MSEIKVIEKTKSPISKRDLIEDIKALGLSPGDSVMFHVSLAKIGWIIGGERTLIEALMEVVTEEGMLVMPSQTGNLSDPALWENPPVPAEWVEKIKKHMPAYDPLKTPAYGIGRVAEYFRTYPGVKRSSHPRSAFAAWGKKAEAILHPHLPGHAFDEESPLHRMYETNFKLLMIGTHYDTLTALHYAESLVATQKSEKELYYVQTKEGSNPRYVWEYDYSTSIFQECGRAFERQDTLTKGMIGQADSRLICMREIIDFAVEYMTAHPVDYKLYN